MPSLTLYTSNRIETLIEKLTELVRVPLRSPFEPETIVVQNRAMERWLTLQLTDRLGICSNFSFPFPNALMLKLFSAACTSLPPELPFDPPLLVWKILELLPELSTLPSFALLQTYLADANPVKAYHLSARIADQFDRYTMFRPNLVATWEAGEDDQWQAHLWRKLALDRPAHRAHIQASFLEQAKMGTLSAALLPTRISVFGISVLPRFHIAMLRALATTTNVALFLLNPSTEFWDDIASQREIVRMQRRYQRQKVRSREPDTTNLHLEEGNTLLASWGAYGREFIAELHSNDIEEVNSPVVPPGNSLLSHIQTDILRLQNPSESTGERVPLQQNDFSIQVHSCHSPMREVAILYQNLLHFFATMPQCKPSDIVVMSPAIERYVPAIDALFGSPEEERLRIPYTIADRPINKSTLASTAFLTLLTVAQSRFIATDVMALLDTAAIRDSFGITEQDLATITAWISATAIRWGRSGAAKQVLHLPGYEQNTWAAGIKQLLLGFALPSDPNDTRSFQGLVGFADIEIAQSELAGKFISFFTALEAVNENIGLSRRLADWSTELLTIYNNFFITEEQDASTTIRAVVQQLALVSSTEPVAFGMIRAHLETALATEKSGPAFLTGGVTFCALVPMRSIPFRVVALIGMDDTAFPRHEQPTAWDLIAQNPQVGDRSLEKEDRYLFLEALLSARETLYISFLGQSVKNSFTYRPSVVVEELLTYIDANYKIASQIDINSIATHYIEGTYNNSVSCNISINHPRNSWSEHAFSAQPLMHNYSPLAAAVAAASTHPEKPSPFFSSQLLPPHTELLQSVTIDDLLRFFKNPARFFMRSRLRTELPDHSGKLETEEPFSISNLGGYQLGGTVLRQLLTAENPESLYRRFEQTGSLPHGTVGNIAFSNLIEQLEPLRASLVPLLTTQKTLDPLLIDLTVGTFRLTGSLSELSEHAQIRFRNANVKQTDFLTIWIKHVILNSFKSKDYPLKSILVALDGNWKFPPLSDAAVVLEQLLTYYRAGLANPLPFFPETSGSYFAWYVKHDDAASALVKARTIWQGNDYALQRPESVEANNATLYKGCDPLSDPFSAIATAIYKPLFGCCTKVSTEELLHGT